MSTIKIWHNPRCSKSREALNILEESAFEKDVVKYLDETPSQEEITQTLKMLNIPARELMRTKESIYKELDLKNEMSEEKLIQAMAENPKLIERPVLFKGNKAIIGRPTELISTFLNS